MYQQFHAHTHTQTQIFNFSISILRWPIVVILNIDLDTKKIRIEQKRNDISFFPTSSAVFISVAFKSSFTFSR